MPTTQASPPKRRCQKLWLITTTAWGFPGRSSASENVRPSIAGTPYTIASNDVVHVDAGQHTLAQNIRLTANNSGARIEGFSHPNSPERRTVLNRTQSAPGSVLFDLQSAHGVTLANLDLTGAQSGIVASGAFNTPALLVGNHIYANAATGISATVSDQGIDIRNNRIQNNGGNGLLLNGPARAVNNIVSGHTTNETAGIQAGPQVRATANDVFGHLNTSAVGIELGHGAVASENRVYRNTIGVTAGVTTGDTSRVSQNVKLPPLLFFSLEYVVPVATKQLSACLENAALWPDRDRSPVAALTPSTF